MTDITTSDVQHLAQLSSLQLSPQETEALTKDISHILAYVEQLSELDTEGVEPTYQVTGLENVWRGDTVDTYGVSREELLALSPDVEAHQIKVPKVL